MTAPERIWVEDEREEGGDVHIYTDLPELAQQFTTSYIRADLLDAAVDAALERAAEAVDRIGPQVTGDAIRAMKKGEKT